MCVRACNFCYPSIAKASHDIYIYISIGILIFIIKLSYLSLAENIFVAKVLFLLSNFLTCRYGTLRHEQRLILCLDK